MSSPQKTTMFGLPDGMARFLPVSTNRGGTNDAAKAEMAHRRLDRLRRAGSRPVTMAIVRRAQMRAALDDHPRELLPRAAHVVAGVGRRHARIDARPGRAATGVDDLGRMPGRVEVARPLPYVAGDVVEGIAVGGEGTKRRSGPEFVW